MGRMMPFLVVLILAAPLAQATNSIVVESKTIPVGASNVRIGIYVSNDDSLLFVVCPLILRSLDPEAFATRVALKHVAGARMAGFLKGIVYNNGFLTLSDSGCHVGNPIIYSPGFTTPPAWQDTMSHAVSGSPVGALFVRGVFMPSERPLPPGTDGTAPSFSLVVDMENAVGGLEIDTACTASANHLIFVAGPYPNTRPVMPSFTKGIITTCQCPHQGDLNNDGILSVLDIVADIDIAFNGDADPQDPGCSMTRGDVNGNSFTDVFDVIYLIGTAFSGGPSPVNPCAP